VVGQTPAAIFAAVTTSVVRTITSIAVPLLVVATRASAQCPDGSPPPCGSTARLAPRATPVLHGSIAVLPFANRSADTADAYLAEELPEQISGRPSRIAQLHVTSATAVAAQWRRTPDALGAARALRVEWLVTGSLRRVAQQVSANVELVRTASGEQGWSSLFRRTDGDIAAIETMVAESVAVAVGGRLAPTQAAALRHSTSRNPEAYRLYLYARSLTARRTLADLDAASQALERAVRLDSGFASAWARFAIVRVLQTLYGTTQRIGRDSLMTLGRVAADRAIGLDSTDAEAWLAQGLWNALWPNPGEAWRALAHAERLDSLDADTEHFIGYLYSNDILGLPDAAEPRFRRALALNPDLRNSWRQLGLSYWMSGRSAEALAAFDSSLSHGAWLIGLSDRALVRYSRGDIAGALADQAAADSLGTRVGGVTIAAPFDAVRRIYALARGDSAPVREFLAATTTTADDLAERALLAAAIGQTEGALAALQQLRSIPDSSEPLCAPRTPCSTSLRTWRLLSVPLFGALQSDPRFKQLREETKPRVPWLSAP
jgi:TolB-like protein/tetratricopeptide (TPR) repeat protein